MQPPDQASIDATAKPSGEPLPSGPGSSPLSPVIQPLTEEESRHHNLSSEKLFSLKQKSRSRSNFAILLLRELFEDNELERTNLMGVRGKGRVDPERITTIRTIVNRFYPVAAAEEASSWRCCHKAMDEFLRRPIWRRKRAE